MFDIDGLGRPISAKELADSAPERDRVRERSELVHAIERCCVRGDEEGVVYYAKQLMGLRS